MKTMQESESQSALDYILENMTPEQEDWLKEQIEAVIEVQSKMAILRGSIKDAKDLVKGELGIQTKQFNQLLTMRLKRNRDEMEEQQEQTMQLYDKLYKD